MDNINLKYLQTESVQISLSVMLPSTAGIQTCINIFVLYVINTGGTKELQECCVGSIKKSCM